MPPRFSVLMCGQWFNNSVLQCGPVIRPVTRQWYRIRSLPLLPRYAAQFVAQNFIKAHLLKPSAEVCWVFSLEG